MFCSVISAVLTALRAGHICLGLVDGGLELNLIDGEQHLTLAHAVAFVDVHLGDETAHLRTDVDVGLAAQGCGIIALILCRRRLYRHHGNLRSLLHGSGALLFSAARRKGAERHKPGSGESESFVSHISIICFVGQ